MAHPCRSVGPSVGAAVKRVRNLGGSKGSGCKREREEPESAFFRRGSGVALCLFAASTPGPKGREMGP